MSGALFVVLYSCCSHPSGTLSSTDVDDLPSAVPPATSTDTATLADTLCYIVGTGDVLPGLNYPEHAPRLPYNDGAHLFDSVRDIMQRADIAFCNLETVLLDTGGTPKKAPTSGWPCYWFRTPERYANHLMDAGYDLVSVANNHQMDFGMEGRLHSLYVLDSLGLACAGAPTHRTAIVERNGVRYGFPVISVFIKCHIPEYFLAERRHTVRLVSPVKHAAVSLDMDLVRRKVQKRLFLNLSRSATSSLCLCMPAMKG